MHNLEMFAKNGLDKCAKGTFKRGILVHSAEVSLNTNNVLRNLSQRNVYKYIGRNERNGIRHSGVEEMVR